MSFFGYCGARPGDDAIRAGEYGRAVAAKWGDPKLHETQLTGHGIWADFVASEGGITVAVAGRPILRAHGSSNWAAATDPAGQCLERYRARGDRVLDEMGGRFSIAVIDSTRRRTILAVDPMGIEYVAFATDDGQFVFGRSAATVANFPGRAASLNPQAVFDYLVLHMVPAPETIFRGVRKLRPGYCAIFEDGRVVERRYWSAKFTSEERAEFEPLKEELHRALRAAVSDCSPDATTGAFLSGGLDSSTVAGVLSEVGPSPTRTFTIGFGYADYDELPFSRTANSHFGCQPCEYVVTGDDIADGFPKIARAYDEPFGNSSALPVYYCARLARDNGVHHLLAGDGGDELFAGNSRYAEQQIFERYRHLPAFVRRGLIEPILASWPAALETRLIRRGRGYVDKANVPLPARLEIWNLMHRTGTEALLHPDFRASVNEGGTLAQMQQLWDSAPAESTLGHMLYYDWQYTLSDNDLRKVETMSALAGVRVSYPMLHPAVIELSMRIPPSLMMPGMKLRDFYKRAMQGYLPDAIIRKKKHGFGLPFGLWLHETPRLRQQIDGNLDALRSRRIIRPEFIDRLMQLHGQEDAKYYGVFIWVLAMLEQWMQEHRMSV